jgi:hypothetical protein
MNMNMKPLFGLGVAGACLLAGVSVFAHHSIAAEFDEKQPVTVTGVVTELEWVNPHSHVSVEGEDANHKKGTWVFELNAAAILMRNGWTRNSVKPGDMVTVNGLLARDNPLRGNARTVTRSDGTKLFSGNATPDASK